MTSLDIRPIIGAIMGALACGIVGFFISFNSTFVLICILLGIIIGFLISSYFAKQKPVDNDAIGKVAIFIFVIGIIGFAIGFMLFGNSGIGIIGGIIGIAIGHVLSAILKNLNRK